MMGQSCAKFRPGKKDKGRKWEILGLTPPERDAIRESWAWTKTREQEVSVAFLTWYIISPSNHTPPAHLMEFIHWTIEELGANQKFRALARNYYDDFDSIIAHLDEPQALFDIVDRISRSYLDMKLSEKDFQNVAFSLVCYLKGTDHLTEMGEVAWIQAINKISVYMWDFIQRHYKKHIRSFSATLLTSDEGFTAR